MAPKQRPWRYAAGGTLCLLLAACGGEPTGPKPRGALAVTVAGLPAGTAGRVHVAGPRGYLADLGATAQLNGLRPGTYAVSAQYVDAQGMTWLPQVSADSVPVAAKDTVPVAVTYAGIPITTLDLSVARAELIQSTQRADGSIPMVGQRDALLRVYVVANEANAVQPGIRVRLFQASVAVDSIVLPAPAASVPLQPSVTPLTSSWNLLIPAARMLPGLSYDVQVDPADQIPEANNGNNAWPAAGVRRQVVVQNVPVFSLRFVPITQTATGLTGDVSNANRDALADLTRRIYPLGGVTLDVRAPFITTAPALQSDDANGSWGTVLGEMNALRSADGSGRHYMGIVGVNYGGGIAGYGYVGLGAAVSWDKPASAPGVIAHELGHNFGRNHAPCGGPGGVDPSFPYFDGSIGTWGLDLPALALNDPAVYWDLMGYCNPDWISDYTYAGVLGYRGSVPAREPGPAADGLMIWGRIRNGAVVLEPAFAVHAPPRLPAQGGPHRVEGMDAAGNRVFTLSFEGDAVPDALGGEERHFAFVVPLAAAERRRLTSLRLTGGGLTAVRQVPAALRQGQPSRAAVRMARRGNAVEVRWDPAYPMAVVRDAVTGEILSFARGGLVRIPGAGRVVVMLSDGVTGAAP